VRLPFFYGWVIIAVAFVTVALGVTARTAFSLMFPPIVDEFGWERGLAAGAFSFGFLVSALVSPVLGRLMDKYGPRLVIEGGVLICTAGLLSATLISTPWQLYATLGLLVGIGANSMTYSVHSQFLPNWFVRRRALAIGIAFSGVGVGSMLILPWLQSVILHVGWRSACCMLGIVRLVVLLPINLIVARRPEDLGLLPDGRTERPAATASRAEPLVLDEPAYSRRQALGTASFWLLLLYTALVYPVQAGVSLHQAPYLIERGIDATLAATIVSTFSLMSAAATVVCGLLPRAVPMRFWLAVTGAILLLSILLMLDVETAPQGFVAAGVFGFAIGAVLTLLPVAWADYFGRTHYGAIRGIALSAQVLAQATGPLLSGALRDLTGDYLRSLQCFAVLAGLSVVAALLARRPTI